MAFATFPVLWHLKASHYNEKARWALDHKRVPHIRRAVTPPRHRAIAPRLNAGRTFPVLVLDGIAIGDSTRIIEALERRYPEPPLYPADPADRRRALELEEFFDEELKSGEVRDRIRGIGKRVVDEHAEALQILAEHDPDDENAKR